MTDALVARAEPEFVQAGAPAALVRSEQVPVPPKPELPKKEGATPSDGNFRQKIAIVALPACIALAGTIWVATRAPHSDQTVKVAGHAGRLRNALLDESAAVVTPMRKARRLLVTQGVTSAAPTKAIYATARDLWYTRQVRYREQAEEIYGLPLANLVFDRTNRNVLVDKCGVLVQRDALERGKACATRLDNEVKLLTARQDAINKNIPIVADPRTVVPKDFTTNLNVANTLLERVIECKTPAAPTGAKVALPADCPNLRNLQFALNLRVNLLGTTQDALADALAKQGPDVQ